MRTRVQKWGNSLALRIPKAFAIEAGVDKGSHVEVAVEDGAIFIRPVSVQRYELSRMLDGITPENVHNEIDFGPGAGEEAW